MAKLRIVIAILATFGCSSLQAAPLSYSSAGSTYSQDFNSLPAAPNDSTSTWVNGTTILGWHGTYTGTSNPTQIRVSDGDDGNFDGLGSYGTESSTDRSLGTKSPTINSGTNAVRIGLQIVNDTGTTLTQFSLQYTGELWRAIGGEPADRLEFDYQIAPTVSITAASGWTNVDQLDFLSPQTRTSIEGSAGLIGNDVENRTTMSYTVTGITWEPGDQLFLRWSDFNTNNNGRAAIGIDDLTFSAAVPEPSSIALMALAVLLGGPRLLRRRTK